MAKQRKNQWQNIERINGKTEKESMAKHRERIKGKAHNESKEN